jgi:hypothetical protein
MLIGVVFVALIDGGSAGVKEAAKSLSVLSKAHYRVKTFHAELAGRLVAISNENGTVLLATEKGVLAIGRSGVTFKAFLSLPRTIRFIRIGARNRLLVGDGESEISLYSSRGRIVRQGVASAFFTGTDTAQVVPALGAEKRSVKKIGDLEVRAAEPWVLSVGSLKITGKDDESGSSSITVSEGAHSVVHSLGRHLSLDWPNISFSPSDTGGAVLFVDSRDSIGRGWLYYVRKDRSLVEIPKSGSEQLFDVWSATPHVCLLDQYEGASDSEFFSLLDPQMGVRTRWNSKWLPIWSPLRHSTLLIWDSGSRVEIRELASSDTDKPTVTSYRSLHQRKRPASKETRLQEPARTSHVKVTNMRPSAFSLRMPPASGFAIIPNATKHEGKLPAIASPKPRSRHFLQTFIRASGTHLTLGFYVMARPLA